MPELSDRYLEKSEVRSYVAEQTTSYNGEFRDRELQLTHKRRVCTEMDIWYNKVYIHEECDSGWVLHKGELRVVSCRNNRVVHVNSHGKAKAWMCNEGKVFDSLRALLSVSNLEGTKLAATASTRIVLREVLPLFAKICC